MNNPSDLWSPTQSPQTMPDGPGESFEAYKAKLEYSEIKRMVADVAEKFDVPEMRFGHDPKDYR